MKELVILNGEQEARETELFGFGLKPLKKP
jgi:hypothetical protein